MAPLLNGCSLRPVGNPRPGGTLRLQLGSEPDTLDPHLTSSPAASAVLDWIQVPLFYQDDDLSYKPWLAERVEVGGDNRVLTLTLRPGVTFHDGTPLDAAAVKFTFERLQQIGAQSPLFEVVKGITAIDVLAPQTVRLSLAQPQATIFHDLGTAYAGLLSRAAVEKAGAGYGRQPVGAGPFRLQEWKPAQELSLVRYPAYAWPEPFYANRRASSFDGVTFRVIPDPAAARQALEKGDLDVLTLAPADATAYDGDPRFSVSTLGVTGIVFLGFNCQKAPFDNRTMRQALSHAVNKEEILRVALGGKLGQVLATPLPPSIGGYDASLASLNYAYDAGRTRGLLGELGYQAGSDGLFAQGGQPFRPILSTTTGSLYGRIATLLQAQFRAAGIDLQIKTLDGRSLAQSTAKGEHDLLLLGWNWDDPDALFLFLSKTRIQTTNRVHFVNDGFEQVVTDARQELDRDRRLKLYRTAQEIVLREAPWQPLYMPVTKTAVTTRLQGVRVHPSGQLLYHDASFLT